MVFYYLKRKNKLNDVDDPQVPIIAQVQQEIVSIK